MKAKESEKLAEKTMPYPSPAMAGGLFAINRQFFYDIGMYDPGLEIWGGENFEISYKLWMCGGGMLFVPCSRVGHVYRMEGWGGNPPPEYVPRNPSFRNYRRVIEVWWDDWAKVKTNLPTDKIIYLCFFAIFKLQKFVRKNYQPPIKYESIFCHFLNNF